MTNILWGDDLHGYGASGHRYKVGPLADSRSTGFAAFIRDEFGSWRPLDAVPNRSEHLNRTVEQATVLAEDSEQRSLEIRDRPLDPAPFIFRYGDHDERARHMPTVSRVGWVFHPRRGYHQDVNLYDEQTVRYATADRRYFGPPTLSDRIDLIDDAAIRARAQDQYDIDPAGVPMLTTETTLPLDPEPWAWQSWSGPINFHRLHRDSSHGWTRFQPRDGYQQAPSAYGLTDDWADFTPNVYGKTATSLSAGNTVTWFAQSPDEDDRWVPCPSEAVAVEFVEAFAATHPNLRVGRRTVVVTFEDFAADR